MKTEAGITRADEHHFFASKEKPLYHLACERFILLIRGQAEEKYEVVANCDHLSNLKFSSALPYAFREHKALMAASVINSERDIETSIIKVATD